MSLYIDGKKVIGTNPAYTFTLLPVADNTYDIGSTTYYYRNAYFKTAIYATSIVGNWNPSATGTYTLGTASLGWLGIFLDAASGADADIDMISLLVTGTPKLWWDESEDQFAFDKGLSLPDDVLFRLGTTFDQVFVHRTAVLNADTALTGVLIGTPDTTALAANSLIISNVTEDGDILIACNDGGHSKQMIFLDGSTGVTHLGKPGTPGYATATGDVYVAGKFEVDGIAEVGSRLIIDGTNHGMGINWESQYLLAVTYDGSGSYQGIRVGSIQAGGTANSWTTTIKAADTDNSNVMVEVARMQGAADPYFSMGGSQENKFYNSGVVTLGGVTTMGANLEVGTIDIDDDSGAVVLVDEGITADPAAGTEESYAFAIDGTTHFKIYAEADSAGSIQNSRLEAAYNLRFTNNEDSTAVVDTMSIGAYEFSAGNRGLAVSAEAVVTASGDIASTHTFPLRYNGVTYNVLCSNA